MSSGDFGGQMCLNVQCAARALARRFAAALAPSGVSHGQSSLMMSLNRPVAPCFGDAAAFLAVDCMALTASLKPLERRGLAEIVPDTDDKRLRRLYLTRAGRKLLKAAVPVWPPPMTKPAPTSRPTASPCAPNSPASPPPVEPQKQA
ncbi:MAG: MarR family winged helix-turn-helix transcriptional regulator [Hyphomonas sp.]|uniref:MarR family winged helix-turn-helix transcriptional regulator n=1 Tax=Hyphomonas sp. TaxID=87 RepID=UPI0034A00441